MIITVLEALKLIILQLTIIYARRKKDADQKPE